MPSNIIHYRTRTGDTLIPPPWEEPLTSRGFTVLKAMTPKQAAFLARSNECLAIIIDLQPDDPAQAQRVQELSDSTGSARIWMIGCESAPLTRDERSHLAWSGLHLSLPPDAPVEYIIHQVKAFQTLAELKRFEDQNDMLVNVAKETRRQLHDINQPLTALLGRLQLIEASLPDEDPACQAVRELIPLTRRMGEMVSELQNYHRRIK